MATPRQSGDDRGTPAICRRLRALREEFFGTRGRSQFARELGIGPSTYAHYETDRVPSAPLLLQASRITRTSLVWLISGDGPRAAADADVDRDSKVLEQIRQLLTERPELEKPLSRFVAGLSVQSATGSHSQAAAADHRRGLIPVLGSTAAGPARYWEELPTIAEGPAIDRRLETLLEHVRPRDHRDAETVTRIAAHEIGTGRVALVQYSTPDERGILEFLDAPGVKARHPAAVAWRIDGDSMSPRYSDGDFVLTSSDAPAVENQPCVARQRGQIGVNCKLFRRDGQDVLLIPINEQHPVQRVRATSLLWAWRVIGSVRIG